MRSLLDADPATLSARLQATREALARERNDCAAPTVVMNRRGVQWFAGRDRAAPSAARVG